MLKQNDVNHFLVDGHQEREERIDLKTKKITHIVGRQEAKLFKRVKGKMKDTGFHVTHAIWYQVYSQNGKFAIQSILKPKKETYKIHPLSL